MANQPVEYVKQNTDAKMVVSTVVGMAVFGAIVWALAKSGVKPVVAAAKAVK